MQTPQTEKTPETLMPSLYETDFYAWTQEQAKLLKHHQWNQLDLPNLIEEIESLGKIIFLVQSLAIGFEERHSIFTNKFIAY